MKALWGSGASHAEGVRGVRGVCRSLCARRAYTTRILCACLGRSARGPRARAWCRMSRGTWRSECQESARGQRGPHRTRGGPNAVALRQGAETSRITCHLLRALGANGHRHERRVTRCELQHAGGAGRPNVLRHLQERLGRSRGEAWGGSRLQAACGRVASAAGLAPSRACRPIGTWSKTPTWLTSRPRAD